MARTDGRTGNCGHGKRWSFTAYEGQWHLFEITPELIEEIGWQTEECPDTQRKHYQGYILTKRDTRENAMRRLYPGVHIELARDWNALLAYCKKTDTAIPGSQVKLIGTPSLTMKDALLKLCSCWDEGLIISLIDKKLTGKDLYKEEYWTIVRRCLYHYPNLVGLYANPIYLTTWVNTRDVWLHLYNKSIE